MQWKEGKEKNAVIALFYSEMISSRLLGDNGRKKILEIIVTLPRYLEKQSAFSPHSSLTPTPTTQKKNKEKKEVLF